MSETYVHRKAEDPHLAAAVLRMEAVEVLAPSGEVLDVVPSWAVARQVTEVHRLRSIVAVLSSRLVAVEAELRALRAAS